MWWQNSARAQMLLESHEAALPGTYESEVSSWVSDGPPHPGQIYVAASEPLIHMRYTAFPGRGHQFDGGDFSSCDGLSADWSCGDPTIYDPLQQGTSGLHVEPSPLGTCHVGDQGDGCLPAWHQAYTSTELLSGLIPATPFPPLMQVGT